MHEYFFVTVTNNKIAVGDIFKFEDDETAIDIIKTSISAVATSCKYKLDYLGVYRIKGNIIEEVK